MTLTSNRSEYRLEVDESAGRLVDPPPVEHETPEFRHRLEEGIATVAMKDHHPTTEGARAVVEPVLKAWEISAALEREGGWIRFALDPAGTRIIDRDPPPMIPGQATGRAHLVASVTLSASGTCTPPTFKQYPAPPDGFAWSPEVDAM